MDADFQLDIAEVNRAVDAAEVVALYFPLLRKTLLMDTRSNDVDGPMIGVVPMAASPEERFKSLRQLRPRFPRADSITIVPWTKYVASLQRLGVWDHVVRRFAEAGDPGLVRQCQACFEELAAAERVEVGRAIRGENYETLWPVESEAGAPPEGET